MTADSDSSSTTLTHQSGGADLNAGRDLTIGGDVVGRDKIVQTIINEAPAPIATSLHQLPPPLRDFTGRETELAELLSKAEIDGVTISGLQGMGGVGKTALALVLAERLKPRYPDAQFYLDLKGADKQPLSVTAALTHVIRAYHPTIKLPESEAELLGLYMSVLEGKRALLLMDNAADKAQVEPLIPPSSCCLLVTSRQHFALPGLFAKDLSTLPPDEARDLLLKIAPRISEQANALAKLCGYLPLALRLVGSALAERRTLTSTGYLKRLENAQTRLELVEASLSLSYDLLREELQQAWCTLAVFPDTFDLAAATAVWNIGENLAQDRLDELARYSLVEWNEATSRAHLHDLARLFANRHLDQALRLDYQRRYAVHYQNVSATANNLYCRGAEQLAQGLALFDLEWTNIQAGHAWAAQNADADGQALSLCDDYPAECFGILSLRQHPRDRINWRETGLAAARKLARKQSEGWHLGNLGSAYYSLGEYRRAIEYHEQHLTIAREIGDLHGEGTALGNLGRIYLALGETHRAIEYHQQHLTIARESGDQLGEATALSNLGVAYRTLGEYRRAIEYHQQDLTIAREIGDREVEGAALGYLGRDYQALGETQRAIAYHEQYLAIAREIGNRLGEGLSLLDLAVCYSTVQDRPQAIVLARAALGIFTAIESRYAQRARNLLAKWQQSE